MTDQQLFNRRVRRFSLAVALIVGMTTGICVWQYCAAEPTAPRVEDRNVTQIVRMLMSQQHLLHHPLDDEISKRAFKLFVEGLDPRKVYFYQSDIDEFKQSETKLDDLLKRNDIQFAYDVFKRFEQRVDERVTLINELLQQKFDFTRDEDLIIEPDEMTYPRNEKEAEDRWRKRIKYDLLALKASDKLEGKEASERLKSRYQNFRRRMKQFDEDELLETYLTAITSSYDPHTNYMAPTSLENFRIALGLKLEGIGAQLQDKDGKTVVARVVPGGAADKHGKLKEEDQIVSVGQGDDGEMEDIVGMKLNDVVKKIRGDAGTVVRLGVIPAGEHERATYKITRAKIELKDSAAKGKVFEVGTKPDGTPEKIGVIDLPSFYMDMEGARLNQRDYTSSTRDVRRILEQFKQKGVDAVVLDLRRNGGGSLTEAINLTGLFIDQGPVVQVAATGRRVEVYRDTDQGMVWDGPLVVVISKFSASASEILAGAIQDYHRGLVVGDKSTHGKGTVQSLLDLGPQLIGGPYAPNLGALKITMQQFFRPNGESTQLRGVLSDIVLPSVTNYMDVSESDLDYPIDFRRVEASQYGTMNLVNPTVVNQLRETSGERIKQSGEFARLMKRIDVYRKQKERTTVTLNEAKFMAERKELDSLKEDEKELEKQALGDNEIKRDFYLNEVMAIAADYVQQLRQQKLVHVN